MTQLQTPFYKIKESDLLYDIRLLKESLAKNWGNYIPGYSVKTNSLPWLLTYLKKEGFYAEVVSDTEYDLAKRLGYPDDKIIYNGPIKDRETFDRVLLNGGVVNMDSSYEPEWVKELSAAHPNKVFHVGLRVNCDIKELCPEEELAEEDGGRFGYCYENGVLGDVIAYINNLPNVSVAGLHLHSSTKSRTVDVYGALAKMAGIIATKYHLNLSFVDMGGGYFGGRADKPDYRDYFARIGKELREYFAPEKTALIVEPGVSLISRATTFETTVLDIKYIRDKVYLVTDGSRVNLNPQVTRHVYPHHIEYASDVNNRKMLPLQWVCGSTCMEYDRLFPIENGPVLEKGDRIVYETAGGYTICLSPLFIHYFPAVYVEKENGELFTARKPWTNEEYLQNNFMEE